MSKRGPNTTESLPLHVRINKAETEMDTQFFPCSQVMLSSRFDFIAL